MGYTHGDIKLQNILYNEDSHAYSLSDFSQACKLFKEDGHHKSQSVKKKFYSNIMFASESMINQKSLGRMDDIESLLYVLCYLKSGSLPVIEYINNEIEVMDMNKFFNYVFEYRQKKAKDHEEKIKELLGSSMAAAF